MVEAVRRPRALHAAEQRAPARESPSQRGYSKDGDWAARHSVLAHPDFIWWWNGANPWEQAPIHLMQLLAWDLEYTGAAPGCMVTLGDPRREWDGGSLQLYTYPADGQTGWRLKDRADELPFTPGDLIGLPRGRVTGPHIYVLATAPFLMEGRIVRASMTDVRGRPVAIKWVDNTTRSRGRELGPYIPPGGIIIPVRPLSPRTTYTVSVAFELDSDPPLRAERTFSFTTGKRHADAKVAAVDRAGVLVKSKSRARAYVEVQRVPGRKRVWSGKVRPGKWHRFRRLRGGGKHLFCFVQPETSRYREESGCTLSPW